MNGFFGIFTKRAEQPIETRDYGKLYFILSGLLFLGTMWAVLDEVSTRRPWKETQLGYFALSETKWGEKLNEAISGFDTSTYVQLQHDSIAAEAKLFSPEVVAVGKEINALEETLVNLNREFTFAKSRGDEAYYFWKKSVHEGKEEKSYKQTLDEMQATMSATNLKIDQVNAKHDSLARIVGTFRDSLKAVRSRVKDLYASIDLAKGKIEKAKTSTILIRQVMTNNFDRSNFGIPKARIDRCQTCHMGWKDDLMEEAPQPYTKHPLPELLKLHKPETFGCTPCHRGQGPALTAGMAHGPGDEYWEWPLLKGKEVYASCNGCHTNQTYVKYGDRFNRAKQMVEESGCFGCHEVKGFNDLAKIGPELNRLAAKTKPEWLFRWVRNPKDYNPHTRMPNFRFTNTQAEAAAAYLWSVAKQSEYHPQKGISAGGNAERGKELVNTIGCKGCHVIGDDVRMRQARGFSYDVAPELSRAGSKLDPDWMYEWIKNPRQYRPATRMPNLRLTDQEARDVVSYLMTMKDDRQLEQVNFDLDKPENVKRGDKLIREYGCTGCHQIQGMEKEGKVSVSLSNFGRKRVDELDFGDTHVPHTWDDWVHGKIQDARQYTTDRIISKMPVFAFADSEIVLLRTLLRGMTKEGPEAEHQQKFDKNLQVIESGRHLTHYYNCINCHQVEEIGGSIKATLDDEGMAPPYLLPEGSKVQEQWLHDFLKAPTPIRPWLKIRMPTFTLTDDEIGTITNYFLALHKKELELRDYQTITTEPKYLAAGKKLFEELQCLSCHYTGKIPEGKGPGDLAPNLALAKSRLKPDWILEWIARPDSITPGTRMPNFYPDMQSPDPDVFGGDAKEQIRALRDHIITITKSQ